MTTELDANRKNLYEADYLKWIETTVEKLQVRDYSSVDWENLIEEIEDMGRSERKSLKNNLIIVLTHLLKWQYQPEFRSGSWKGSIVEQGASHFCKSIWRLEIAATQKKPLRGDARKLANANTSCYSARSPSGDAPASLTLR